SGWKRVLRGIAVIMAFDELSEQEQGVVLQCLSAILNGPFIDDWEFQTRLGIDRTAVLEVLAAWPNLDDADPGSATSLAINNCMNEALHGVEITPDEWSRWFQG